MPFFRNGVSPDMARPASRCFSAPKHSGFLKPRYLFAGPRWFLAPENAKTIALSALPLLAILGDNPQRGFLLTMRAKGAKDPKKPAFGKRCPRGFPVDPLKFAASVRPWRQAVSLEEFSEKTGGAPPHLHTRCFQPSVPIRAMPSPSARIGRGISHRKGAQVGKAHAVKDPTHRPRLRRPGRAA